MLMVRKSCGRLDRRRRHRGRCDARGRRRVSARLACHGPRTRARTRAAIPALLVIVAALGGACGGEDGEGRPGDSFPGTADYSISTAELDRELACKGGKEELRGEGENDPLLLVHGTSV